MTVETIRRIVGLATKASRSAPQERSEEEFRREMGYAILSVRLKDDPDAVADADAEEVLATIESEIHRSPNWARYAMNGALISIGIFKPALRKKAIAAVRRIGKVEVDAG